MKRLLIILAILSATPSIAAEAKGEGSGVPAPLDNVKVKLEMVPKTGLTMNDCVTVLSGLRGLDGYSVVTNAGKPNEASFVQAYKFGNASLRSDIAQNLARLNDLPAQIEKTRQQIFTEVAKGETELKPNSPEALAYQKQLVALGESPCYVTLIRIKQSDLKLETNEIPGTVLGALDKILDR